MKSKILVILLLSLSTSYAQVGKRVMLHCEVLGKQNGNVRYYHPIEGEYVISKMYPYKSGSIDKHLKDFVLIDPYTYLQDSVTTIYANSLRHYLDPREMVYVNWQMGWDTAYNEQKLDTFRQEAKFIRKKKYQPIVGDYFKPFYISKYEITNKEYREFCHWVVDSMMRELIYANTNPTGDDEISDEVILEMLDYQDSYFDEVDLEWQEIDPSEPLKNRENFYFNYDFDWRKEIEPRQYIPLISELYEANNQRFYKRRNIDTDKIKFKYWTIDLGKLYPQTEVPDSIIHLQDSVSFDSLFFQKKGQNNAIRGHNERSKFIHEHEINVWPDTTQWAKMKWFPFNSTLESMYFWHPAFDNYPVVNVSHEQAEAYAHWKTRMLWIEHPDLANTYELHLPNAKEIEWCALKSSEHSVANTVSDDQVVTNLLLGDTLDPYVGLSEMRMTLNIGVTQEVWSAVDVHDSKSYKKLQKYLDKQEKEHEKHEFNRSVVETRSTQNYLSAGVEFLSNNVSEWMEEDYETHYEKLIEAYINFKCFQNVDYCQYQRFIDQGLVAENDKNGKMIMGSNWFDERYGTILGVNTAGMYPKRFMNQAKSFPTVGFRLVLRPVYFVAWSGRSF